VTGFILRRFLIAIPTALGVSVVVFLLMSLMGNDPVTALLGPDTTEQERTQKRIELGLDQPLPVQYLRWLSHAVQGDFGQSFVTRRDVATEVFRRLPATIELAVCTMFIATLTAVFVALMSARRPGGKFDTGARTVIFVFLAMPSFWLGIELIILGSRTLGWFPPSGRGSGSLASHISHLVLPALTLGVGTGASLSRILRASLLEVLNSDYIRTARAKGLNNRVVLMRHALRNALIPFLTLSGLTVAALLEGSVIVETVFAWPGVGSLMVEAVRGGDRPVAMAGVVLVSLIYIAVNLIVDILYGVVDPRIRAGQTSGGH
jgi:ABC-type dipeptide/oligopeptide/nickel transport system permease component